MKKRTLALSMCMSFAIALTLIGCSKAATTETATVGEKQVDQTVPAKETVATKSPEIRDTINCAIAAEPATLDLQATTTNNARLIMSGTVYEQLLVLDGNGVPVPELCESFSSNDAKTEFTFNLRHGVLFHDGTEMKAEDVVASLNRWVTKFSAIGSLLGDARFEAKDDYTVTIKTKAAVATLPYLLAGSPQRAVITTVEALNDLDAKGNLKSYVGTGPYRFDEWKLDQYIKLSKFDQYVPYGDPKAGIDGSAGYKHAYAKELMWKTVPEETTRIAGLSTGEFDYANLGSMTQKAAEADSNLVLNKSEGGSVTVVFNKAKGWGSNQAFRSAINSLVDCEELLMSMYDGLYIMDSNYMETSQVLWNTQKGSENYNQKDQAKAKSYLKEAGYNGEPVKLLVSSANNFSNLGAVLKSEMEAIGMKVDMTVVDWATFTSYRTDPERFDMYITSFSSVVIPTLKNYFNPKYAGWTNDAKLTEMLQAFNNALSLDECATIWKDIQDYCWTYLPLVNIGHYVSLDACSKRVQGVVYNNGNPQFFDAYAKK